MDRQGAFHRRDVFLARGFELRTVTTNVLGFAELLADPSLQLSPERRCEYAEIIAGSAGRLEALQAETVAEALALVNETLREARRP